MNRQVALQKERESITGVKTLQEVIVTSRRIIKDSKNLHGSGEADIVISEEELEKAGRTTLGDLLKKNVSGFGLRRDKHGNQFYAIYTMRAHLIIDGMNTQDFLPGGLTLTDHLKHFFDYYDAEEIRGIEVMTSGKYQMRYTSTYVDPMAVPWEHAFIEVTTRGGAGPFLKKAVGTYLYKPMPLVFPAAFYMPQYKTATTPDLSDIRSTIFWEPSIITGEDGKATVRFYTADNPGSYSIVIEGSDMEGNIGIKRSTISVKKLPL